MKCIINLDQYCNLLISVLNSLLLRVLDLLYHVCQCCLQFPYRACNTDTNKDPIKTHSIKVHATSVILPKDFQLMFEHQSFPHLRLNNCLSRWSNTVTCFYTLLGVGRYWSAVHIPCQLDQTNGGLLSFEDSSLLSLYFCQIFSTTDMDTIFVTLLQISQCLRITNLTLNPKCGSNFRLEDWILIVSFH